MALRERLRADVRAAIDRDPATERALEVLLTSPGLYARWSHRLAHWLWNREHGLLARVLATISRLITGIEIHPGADLGERIVIDHGQGLVIGSTATVGDDVLVYHGVTLGAREEIDGQRHPTVGDDVTLGANATVLGDIDVGDGARVGAGAVVVDPVAPDDTVVGVPAEPVEDDVDGIDAAPAAVDSSAGSSTGGSSAESSTDSSSGDAVASSASDGRELLDASERNGDGWHRQDACDDLPAADDLPTADDDSRRSTETNGAESGDGATVAGDDADDSSDDGPCGTPCEAPGSRS